jgi:hypothetical protein
MKNLALFILTLFYISADGQVGPIRNWIDSEVKYSFATQKDVIFTHSLPKGGGLYYLKGIKYSHVIFWTRIHNQTSTPIKLQLTFPDITYLQSPNAHIKILLPKDTMSHEKEQLFNYGLTGLDFLLNDNTKQVKILKKTIDLNRDYYFYIPVFMHEINGIARASIVLKGEKLFYKISIGKDTAYIPCGSLVADSKKLK